MIHLARSITALVIFALTGAAGADESPPAPSGPATGVPSDGSVDWSQTHLSPEPALRQQYNRTRTFLDEKVTEVDGQISKLKTDGVLDRRSATKIRSALSNARVSMTGMAGGMQQREQVDGWTARMFAYELGMAADTLTQQASKIEMNLETAFGSDDGLSDRQSRDLEQQRQLAKTLNDTSVLLRETARAITDNLK